MKTVTKEIYKCDHCNKWYHRKHHCERHEKRCSKNPENDRACFNCQYLEGKDESIYIDENPEIRGEVRRTYRVLFCNKKQQYVYPPKAEHKGNVFDMGDFENNPMPRECEFKKLFGM